MIAQHLSTSVELYTPAYIADAARAVLGTIDLDPASCPIGNEVMKAKTFYTEGGLQKPWFGNLWLNPPGGRAEIKGMGTDSNAALWWAVCAQHYKAGNIRSALFLGFTLEILSTAQVFDAAMPKPLDFPLVVSRGRTCFDVPKLAEIERLEGLLGDGVEMGTGEKGEKKRAALVKRHAEVRATPGNRVTSESPTHANVFVYLPPRGVDGRPDDKAIDLFDTVFSEIGQAKVARYSLGWMK